MPAGRSNDDIIRRIRASVNLARFASDDEADAAINAVARIMENNTTSLLNIAPPPKVTIIDNRGAIDEAMRETAAAERKIEDLEKLIKDNARLITEKDDKIRQQQNRIKQLEKERRELQNENNDIADPLYVATRKPRREKYDLVAIKAELDQILAPVKITPSAEIAVEIKKPNLLDVMTHLPIELAKQFSHETLEQDIFAKCADMFLLKAQPRRQAARKLVAMLNNAPFNEDDKRQKTMLGNVNNAWQDPRKEKAIPPWVAFVVKCGILQANVHRLTEVAGE